MKNQARTTIQKQAKELNLIRLILKMIIYKKN